MAIVFVKKTFSRDNVLRKFCWGKIVSFLISGLIGALLANIILVIFQKKLTTERALLVNCIMSPAYCTVVELSSVERIGIPKYILLHIKFIL